MTFPDGTVDRVRLIGIDTPEVGEPLADQASDYLASLVVGEEITMVSDGAEWSCTPPSGSVDVRLGWPPARTWLPCGARASR